jgi:hypothetical protein
LGSGVNIEELKLIIQAVGALGEQGKEAFLWYLAAKTIPSFILWGAFIGAVYFLIRHIFKAIDEVNRNDLLRKQFTLWRGSIMPNKMGYLDEAEIAKIVQVVDKLLKERS